MSDTTVTKVDSRHSPRGPEGQKYLASSPHLGMRLWEDEPPGEAKPDSRREYETVGYVIRGKAELVVEGRPSGWKRVIPGSSPAGRPTVTASSKRLPPWKSPTPPRTSTAATSRPGRRSKGGGEKQRRG